MCSVSSEYSGREDIWDIRNETNEKRQLREPLIDKKNVKHNENAVAAC